MKKSQTKKFIFKLKKNDAKAVVEITLTEDGVFTASGSTAHYAGQCLDEINKIIIPNETFDLIYKMWKLHHLNDLHAGTEKQEKAPALTITELLPDSTNIGGSDGYEFIEIYNNTENYHDRLGL